MPCFTAPIDGNGQLLANAWVTDATRSEADLARIFADMSRGAEKVDDSEVRICSALLDTGANMSCVTERVAKSLNLNIQGTETIASVSESTDANLYRVNIHVPFGGAVVREGDKMKQNVMLSNSLDMRVFGIPGIGESYDVLLGIDFIRHGALHVSSGHFTFCI